MNTRLQRIRGFPAQLLGLFKWLGLALLVPVYMVVGGALVAAVLFLLFLPLDYLFELTDSWRWGTWGRALDTMGYIFIFVLLGLQAFKRWAPANWRDPTVTNWDGTQTKLNPSEWAEFKLRESERLRQTRIDRWMARESGNPFGIIGGVILFIVYAPAFSNLLRPLDKWVEAIGASIFTWIDNWVGGIVGTGWGPWILPLAPIVAFIVAGTVFPRYAAFFVYAILLWILGSGILFAFNYVMAFIVFIAFVVAGSMIGRELGWIAAVIKNAWEDRRAQAKNTDTNSD
ncbi:MAG: hypothetical protein HY067_02245 [Betaproteobacteria bacterium]|nr:hypothetical protein [Betaproteobacteria bacterium]